MKNLVNNIDHVPSFTIKCTFQDLAPTYSIHHIDSNFYQTISPDTPVKFNYYKEENRLIVRFDQSPYNKIEDVFAPNEIVDIFNNCEKIGDAEWGTINQ